jgi:hypothetical protein
MPASAQGSLLRKLGPYATTMCARICITSDISDRWLLSFFEVVVEHLEAFKQDAIGHVFAEGLARSSPHYK